MNFIKLFSHNAIIYYYANCTTDVVGAIIGAIYITYNDRKKMKVFLIVPLLFFVACFSPSTPHPIPTLTHVKNKQILDKFTGDIYSSAYYTYIFNEDADKLIQDTSKIGLSDSLLIISSSILDVKLYVKKIIKQQSTSEVIFFTDFDEKRLTDTLNYDAVLCYSPKRKSIQFSYKEYAFFFNGITK